MKKYSIYLKIRPSIITLTAEQIYAKKMLDEISGVFLSDMESEEKKKRITEINNNFFLNREGFNNNLKVIKSDYESMNSFYVFNNFNHKRRFAVSYGEIIPQFYDQKDESFVELSCFIGFSERVAKEIFINGEKMIAVCSLENQLIVCKNGAYGVLVDDGSKEIKYGKKVDFRTKPSDIEDSVIDVVELELSKGILSKRMKQ